MAIFLGMMLSMFFLEPTPTLAMIETSGIQRPLLVFIESYVFYIVIRNYIALRSLSKSLSQGSPINHKESWQKPRLINGFIGGFFILAAFLTACIPFVEIAQSKTYTLPETSVNLPTVRLADIERNPALEREGEYNLHGVDWGNRVGYDWSPLAPVQYEINEHGTIKNMVWDDNSGSYSPSIETRYYRLAFSSMAINLIHDLMERYVDDFDPKVTVQEVDHPFFDQLLVAEDGIRKQIFACSGNEVIYVNYFGNGQAEDIITLIP
jgi:hypothetical protein